MTDSNSGITQAEAGKLGIRVIPMPFTIGDRDYLEDINLTQDQFYELLSGGQDVKTSQPSPETLLRAFDEELQNHDEIIYIPMSSGLSGSCQSAMMIAQDYEGRVHVVDNQRISVTQRQSVLDAIGMAAAGLSADQIVEKLMENRYRSHIYIMMDTLYYLKKGGRITPAAAAIGTLLKIKPVLQIQGEKLDAFAKARTSNQGCKIMLNTIREHIEQEFGGLEAGRTWISGAYTGDRERGQAWQQEIMEAFPGEEIPMYPLSLSVACHIGPGALAVTCTEKIDY